MPPRATPTLPGLFDDAPAEAEPRAPAPSPVPIDWEPFTDATTIKLPAPGGHVMRADLRPCHCGELLWDVARVERTVEVGGETRREVSVVLRCSRYYAEGHRPEKRGRERMTRLGTVDVATGVMTLETPGGRD